MFRYTATRKQRRYIYARSLEELRRKEAEIQRDLADGIDYAAGEMTVLELVTRYMDLKRTLKENSYRAYDTVINRMRKDPFSQKQIRQIKPSDAKAWFVSLHDRGYKQSTISTVQCVVRPAFEMAVDDDMIRKNPFKFKLSDVIPKDAFVRTALTREQQDLYLQFFQEYGGGSTHGAKLRFAYCEATVPKITVTLRKAYGGAYIAMCCKDLGADAVFAWPGAEIAVMGAEGAVPVLYGRELKAVEDPAEKAKRQGELLEEYREAFYNPYVAAGMGQITEVINPEETRAKIAFALRTLLNKKEVRPAKKHGNIPL